MTEIAAVPQVHGLPALNETGDLLPRLNRIREESPVTWVPELRTYLITRHSDILSVLKDRRYRNANIVQGLDRLPQDVQDELLPLRQSINLWMGWQTSEADHARYQQLLKRYFTPAKMNGLRPRIRELTHELLDAVMADRWMEVVHDLAYPLPANVIAEIFGMPTSRRDQLRVWSRDIVSIFHYAEAEPLLASQRSVLDMQDYVRTLVTERRQGPRDDLISALVAAERDGMITEEEIVANCVLLLFAGHETTAGLISQGLVLLFENPEQLALLKSQPDLMPSAVEEMLRCSGPVQFVHRTNTEPVTIAGHSFPEGESFCLAVVTGNHDPEAFPEPDRFDITRQPNQHTGFGMGAYYCLGAALARVETDECLRVLLDRLPDIRPAYRTPAWRPVSALAYHLETLPVEF